MPACCQPNLEAPPAVAAAAVAGVAVAGVAAAVSTSCEKGI